ncbi:hypothetical protein T440DRAFT_469241 [Plenodomus tracheiphilus IPT5]|uniref:CFEM domain-containing protein n=1 Tax=Plenodomus tracheiphilus IPT5 TaxID=1408161 RepID=A0A6A7B4V3_9PLEO|nr:hypothetical protein T440DRAFT_469241 [Plenodomus tracheiphilus IPT5]
MGVRAIIAAILCLLTLVNAAVSGTVLESRELGLADIPACGITCLLLKVPETGCATTDTPCICRNAGLAQSLSECMLANCTMVDTVRTARVQADICDLPEGSKRTELFWYSGIVYSIAILFVVLRVSGKLVSDRLSMDDYIVVLALVLAAVPLGCVLAMTKLGFGLHVWSLGDGVLLRILRFFYIAQATYVVVLGMIKVSLVLFYLEIFKTNQFKISAYVVIAYIIVNSLIIFLLTVFSCKPVDSFWNRDIKGQCMDVQALAFANSASAIVQDAILLILPLVSIRNLQMKRYRKLAVSFMFSIGTFGCIATIIRLHSLLHFSISVDPTWDYVQPTIWTELELAAGFVCVSLPSIRILLVRILPVGVKEFLSHISHSASRSRSHQVRNQDPSSPQSKEWNEPSTWVNISHGADSNGTESKSGKSFFGGFLSRNYGSPFSSQARDDSRHLESALSSYSEPEVAVTRPPYQERRRPEDAHVSMELLELPKTYDKPGSMRSGKSSASRSDQITALPSIGCLPERTFSMLDVTRSRDNHV